MTGGLSEAAAGDKARFLVYGGAAAARDSAFLYQGVRMAFSGDLDASGLIADAMTGAGIYRYESSDAPGGFVEGQSILARLTAGYQFVGANAGIALQAGVDYQNHTLLVDDPGNPVQGTEIGAVLMVDGWAKPWDGLLLSGHANASTAFQSASGRLRAGFDLPFWTDLRLGPELGGSRNEDSWQMRAGAFVEAAVYDGIHLSLYGGYYRGRDDDEGYYAGLSGWRKF